MEEDTRRFFQVLASLYGLIGTLCFFKFSYDFAVENSFVTWLFFGFFVPAMKSMVWPFFVF